MPTGYQLLPFPCRHKREGDDFPNLEAQQENEPTFRIECLFGFYRSVSERDFATRVSSWYFPQVSKILFGSAQRDLGAIGNLLRVLFSEKLNPSYFAGNNGKQNVGYVKLHST